MNTRTYLLLAICLPCAAIAQTTRVAPWQPPLADNDARVRTYHPEPILFIHGNNANDSAWGEAAIPALTPEFTTYDLPNAAKPLTGQFINPAGTAFYNATQTNYLHTFNYGNYVYRDVPHNRQSYEHIEWNASQQVMTNASLCLRNPFRRPGPFLPPPSIDCSPNDLRQTLDMRINEIRTAYRPDPTSTNEPPRLVLVAHSTGALVAHYAMLVNAPNHGVRRLITVSGAHQGTSLANFLLYDTYTHTTQKMFNSAKDSWKVKDWRKAGHTVLPLTDEAAGFFLYGDLGAIEDLVEITPNLPPHLSFSNEFLEVFWNNPAPKIEYVFNAYRRPPIKNPLQEPFIALKYATQEPALVDPIFVDGDGFVPTRSAVGKDGPNSPSIWNGRNNANGMHDIDPVIFGKWLWYNHSQAVTETNSLLRSLFGVPYRWPGLVSSDWPFYARTYGENQSFSKYFSTPSSGLTAYTDEPGIKDLKLLYKRAVGNPLLVPALNTWSTNSSGPQKTVTNANDFASHQIVAGTGGGFVRFLGTTGTKNRSENPVGANGTNYWVMAGNEYLPASLMINCAHGEAPQLVAENVNYLASPKAIVTNCLVQLTNGAPQYQYGYFEGPPDITVTPNTNNYVAVQGFNLANLLTPQAERAFNTPVDSATLVDILKKINAGESLSNACHDATEPTRWTAPVDEWITTPASGVFKLNFFPTDDPSYIEILSDAWTGEAYDDWDYDVHNNQITLTDVANAPSQLVGSYEVYLGCEKVFTNSYGGIVRKLDEVNLAGVQITPTQLYQVRTALEGILSKYKDNNPTICTNWSLTNILVAAVANYTGAWTPVTNNLLTVQHFTELKNVAAKLTTEISCCGACCLPDGTCGDRVLQSVCSGIYKGDGTKCADISCLGACCDTNSGTCTLTAPISCSSNSVFHGVGTHCTPNPCPQPTGACCDTNSGACTLTTQTNCTSPKVWNGPWTTCTPTNPCPSSCGCNPLLPDTITLVQSVEFFTGEYYPFDCSGNHGIWDVNECPEVITLSKTSPCTYSSGPVGSWHHNCTSCNGCPDNCPERSGTYQWSVTFGSTISVLGWGGCGSVFEGTMTRPEPCLPVTIPNDITDWLPCCGGNPGQGGSVTLEIP